MPLHDPMLRQLRSLLLSSGLLLGVLLASGQAQVTTTITPDGTLGTAVTQSGTVHNITGGTRPGNGPNLFHSFDRFSVGTNDTARFSGPTGIVNILSRVTGGQQSSIDGLLQSTIPGANLYLLNPSGVMFGSNASLDVSGSFHVSTADFLRFADGATFSANVGEKSTLTVAPPSAFGFLRSNPAGISIAESSLQVAEGKTMSVVGGDIAIVGGPLTSPQAPSLGAPSGRINIASVASPGEVDLNLSGQVQLLNIGTFGRLGEIHITQRARLDTSGNGAGTTVIRGGRLLVDNGSIVANNTGNIDSPDLGIDVRMRGDVRLTGEAQLMSTTSLFSRGRGGNISVAADNITIEGGALLSSISGGLGPGGDIAVIAPTGTISLNTGGRLGGGGILASSLPFSSGSIGEIRVEAGKLVLANGAVIGSLGLGVGKSGNVMVSARESAAISGMSSQGSPSGIVSFTVGEPGTISLSAPIVTIDGGAVGAPGILPGQRAGDITVKADQQLTLVNGAQINSATLTDSKGGNITIEAGRFTLTGAQIISGTLGPGAGGSVTVTATDTVILAGTTPSGSSSGIVANTQGTAAGAGAAGSIVVTAPRITVTEGAGISSSTLGPGAGGSVTVTATDTVLLAGTTPSGRSSGIVANAQGTDMGAGAAGSIVVTAPHITVTGGAGINSNTLGPGAGGSVMVTASDTLTLTGTTPSGAFASGIFANAQGTDMGAGAAGSIVVTAPHITVTEGAGINSSTLGPGAGGSVMVTASDTLTLTGTTPSGAFVSGIFANAQGTAVGAGAAGSIVVTAPRITVTEGAGINSSTLGPGAGGSVMVTVSDTLTLIGTTPSGAFASGIFANAQGTDMGAGAAGSIVVTAPHITVTGGAGINSSTLGPGAGGSVTVMASDTLTLAGTAPSDHPSGIFANAQGTDMGAGAAGSIVVTAPRVMTTDGAQISSSTFGPGLGGSVIVTATDTVTLTGTTPTGSPSGIFANAQGTDMGAGAAGSIVVTAPRVMTTDGAQISSSTFGPGLGGSVTVMASDTLTLAGTSHAGAFASGIFANAQGTDMGAGAAGNIMVTAPHLMITGGAQISSSSQGPGAGGSVTVTASDTLTLTGIAPSGDPSGILANAQGTDTGAGAAGSIVVTAPRVMASDGAQITSSTFGPGLGGSVMVMASDMLTLTGIAPTGRPSGIFATAQGTAAGAGAAGSIVVTAPRVMVSDGAQISSSTSGPGSGGSIMVTTPQLTMADGGSIGVETGGDGRGGDVVVQVGHLSLTGGAQIRSGSGLTVQETLLVGTGAGGTVSVTATDTVDIAGPESGLSASTVGQGRGGDVLLQARQVRLTDGATISAESTGLGNAGNVIIATSDTVLSTKGSVVTRATQADGGNIQITAPNFLRLRDSRITAEVGGGAQTVGGNITIDPQFVVLQNSQIVANAFAGQGGNIHIQAQRVFLADPASQVSASSALGINGVVNIQAPVTSISGAVAPLPQEFASIAELLRDRCAGRLREGRVSRLVLGGRDGVPSEPGSLLLSPLLQTDPRENGEQAGTPARTGQVQERAWHVQAGALAGLDAECARWIGPKGSTVQSNTYP